MVIMRLDRIMVKNENPYTGKWRIIEMEMWDQDYVDEVTV